jgi:DNA-directed RNA polymerase subunit M/transcription elongation factor TFIIS
MWVNNQWVSIVDIEKRVTESLLLQNAVASIPCEKCGNWMTKVETEGTRNLSIMVFVCQNCDHTAKFPRKINGVTPPRKWRNALAKKHSSQKNNTC